MSRKMVGVESDMIVLMLAEQLDCTYHVELHQCIDVLSDDFISGILLVIDAKISQRKKNVT